jgi:ketosteroid isomerase-like protein
MSGHVETVKRIYDAFGRGDVETIVANVSDDTEWGFNVGSSDVPWHVARKGRESIPQFFASLGGVQMQAFEPRAFFTDASHVAALVHIDYVVRKTGRRVVQNQIHLWRFDPNGKVAQLTHFEDTAQVVAACAG